MPMPEGTATSLLDLLPPPGEPLVGAEVTATLAAGDVVRGVDFVECRFVGGSFTQARLLGCRFEDCEFDGVDLSMTDLLDSRITGGRFVGCKMLALAWGSLASGAVLEPVHFERCRLDYASFAGCDLTRVQFIECRLIEADLTGAVLRHTAFSGSDLTGARFGGTDLRDASLVGASGWILDPRDNLVAGLHVEAADAAGVLGPLGILVR